LPTGPAIVAAFGAATALAVISRASLRSVLMWLCGVVAVSGLVLIAAPQVEQPWLPEEMFLSADEREIRADSLQSVESASSELARLRELEQDVRWGRERMDPEKQERLRQYLAGRSEILAGDQLVLKALSESARERQRYVVGIPLLLIGLGALAYLFSGRARSRPQ
jgi:hypothetical protein